MREVKIKTMNIFPLITELLEKGQSTKITVSGDSMYPFLRDGIDSVELSKGRFEDLKRGDIAMFRRRDGAYVMHRIYKRNNGNIFIVGDAQKWIEGPLQKDQFIAVVNHIWRKNKKISCNNIWYKLTSLIWLVLRPCRLHIFKIYNVIRKIFILKSRTC